MTTTRTANALVAACYDRSCRPPTSGGTGGSSPLAGRRMRLQHVASKENAASIRKEGFRTDTPEWVKSFGNGVYFAFHGDEKSRKFYQRQGPGRTPRTSEVIRAEGILDNPAEFSIRTHSEFRNQAADLLGGKAAVKAKAQRMYDDLQEQAQTIFKEELGDEYEKVNYVREGKAVEDAFFWDITVERYDRAIARFREETGLNDLHDLGHLKNIAQNDDIWVKKPQASDVHSDESQILGNMLRDEGYDGLIINTRNWAGVGGEQVVVFDPKKVSIVASCHSRACAPPPVGRGGSDRLVKKVRSVLTDDLRKAPYKGSCNPMTGHCYVAAEALYHAMGGRAAGLTPHQITHEGSPHWFLKTKEGRVIDPTADQFKTPVPYEKARGKGFLTRQPSKRAREVLRRVSLDS